jgi:hypothetical protein
MIEAAIFGFVSGCLVSGLCCFRIGYQQRIYDTREITAAKDAKLEAYESMLGIMKVKKELH